MATLISLMSYFCRHYPKPEDLSVGRLTKMVYLADWRAAITLDRQLTAIRWRYDHYGPYVHHVREMAENNPDIFTVESFSNRLGNPKRVIRLTRPEATTPSDADAPGADEQAILDHVIRTTRDLGWGDFIRLVYSTYPILIEAQYASLDLVELAGRYKAEKEVIDRRRSA